MKHSSTQANAKDQGVGFAASVRRGFALAMCVLVMVSTLAMPVAAQDEAEPQPTQDPALVENDPLAPQDDQQEAGAESTPASEPQTEPEQVQEQPAQTPVAEEDADDAGSTGNTGSQVTRTAQRADDAAGPGYPAVLAHGLAYVTGDDVVWQVREVVVDESDEASPTVSEAAVLLQRDGSSVIRNDVTGKRAKTDPGEGYFRAAGDGYTIMAENGEPILWQFELVNPDDVALDAFYESPTIEGLDEGVYDMMMTRYVLPAGESVDLPEHSGAALVMTTSGEVEIDAGGERSALAEGDGQTLQDSATASNATNTPVVFVYVYLGDEVSDASAGAPQATTSQETADTADEEATDATTEADAEAADTAETTESTEAEADTSGEEAAAAETDDAGNYITSINVTADAEIYLTITVDGLTVFDGTLPAGSSSGPVVGTNFEVYTSSGVNTNFTNACGEVFKMGYEEGEVVYSLVATAESCAP